MAQHILDFQENPGRCVLVLRFPEKGLLCLSASPKNLRAVPWLFTEVGEKKGGNFPLVLYIKKKKSGLNCIFPPKKRWKHFHSELAFFPHNFHFNMDFPAKTRKEKSILNMIFFFFFPQKRDHTCQHSAGTNSGILGTFTIPFQRHQQHLGNMHWMGHPHPPCCTCSIPQPALSNLLPKPQTWLNCHILPWGIFLLPHFNPHFFRTFLLQGSQIP